MNPPIKNYHDELAAIRNELYVVESLLLSLTICAERQFNDCEEEADVLANHAHGAVKEVIAKADRIVRAYDEAGRDAA